MMNSGDQASAPSNRSRFRVIDGGLSASRSTRPASVILPVSVGISLAQIGQGTSMKSALLVRVFVNSRVANPPIETIRKIDEEFKRSISSYRARFRKSLSSEDQPLTALFRRARGMDCSEDSVQPLPNYVLDSIRSALGVRSRDLSVTFDGRTDIFTAAGYWSQLRRGYVSLMSDQNLDIGPIAEYRYRFK